MRKHTIAVDAGKYTAVVVILTTFRLHRHNSGGFKMLFELSSRVRKETGLDVELLIRGDKILHLTSSRKISKEVLLQKVEIALGIIKEIYDVPQARIHIQQGLF